MNPLAQVFRFGNIYLLVDQIERIQFLTDDTVEIRTRTDTLLFQGTSATQLRTYLNERSQAF